MIKFVNILTIVTIVSACNYSTRCKKYYFENNFSGRVVVYFNQKNASLKYDKDGCIVYNIPASGEFYTPEDYTPSIGEPNKTIRYFEKISNDKFVELLIFRESEYLSDTAINKDRKYIFGMTAALTDSGTYLEYYVDYGKNYKTHFFIY